MRIVYNSFHGRFADNPRAVYERLEGRRSLDQLWLADPEHSDSFPADTETVPIDSPEAVDVLESADIVIANTHTELEWVKPSTTTYLQTWHGTPLKRIHRDVLWAPEGRLDRLDRDVARWDLLISPNAVSTPRLRSAFRYDGEVLETGYPRNDVLSAPDLKERRREILERLDIERGVTVILYAPTWRDDEAFQDGLPTVPLALDLEDLSNALGAGYVVLARLHPQMTGRSLIPLSQNIRDMSMFPDVRDLYLAADVLVTDYSSSMFDFAITGRPMVFFTYDLERFRDSVRGFYFDFLPEAPGPVVSTAEELAQALRSSSTRSDRYPAFRRKYCYLEDGHATDRLLTRLGLETSH